ncbi:MAG: hypothetical protein ACM3ZE_04270 [Myxococcales bacterium]
MRRFSNPLIIASSLLFFCGQASAGEVHEYKECQKQPTEADVQGAKGAFQAGTVSYNEADYERAILFWEDAYRRDCTATLLLLHLARAYEGQGNLEQALVALHAYLARAPSNAPDRPKAERLVVAFEQKLDSQKRSQTQVEEEQKPKEDQPPPTTAPSTAGTGPAYRHLYVKPIIPIAVAGVGISAFVVGGIIFGTAQSDVSDYDEQCKGQCPDRQTYKDAEDAKSRRDWGLGIGVTGLVLAGGGIGWYFFNEQQKPNQPARTTALLPWLSPSVAGLSYRGSF